MSATPRRSPRLFCFGLGYSARALLRHLAGSGIALAGTCREEAAAAAWRASGVAASVFDREHDLPAGALDGVSHILVSVPPDAAGDPVADRLGPAIAALPGLSWLGYLSTTGVYGNRDGGWVDESAALLPSGERGRRRVAAEALWQDLWHRSCVPVHIFRLAGIYGPGRSAFESLRAGTAQRIDKPGQVFSRIHVDDVALVLAASIARPLPGAVYNVADDEPAAPAEVVAHAASLLGRAPPPLVPFAAAELSPMARSFYDDSKRVANGRIRRELGVSLRYPDYRAGLAAILATRRGEDAAPPGA